MEILPIAEIRDSLVRMAEYRVRIHELLGRLDRSLMEFDLSMIRSMGNTGNEYELSNLAGKAVTLLDSLREIILKDGMIGQLELKAGIIKPLDEEQYHEKEGILPEDGPDSERKNELSVFFIANKMSERMHKISLAEEDYYYQMRELLPKWREYLFLTDEGLLSGEEPVCDRVLAWTEELSLFTEKYLKEYLIVMNTTKNVVLKNYLFITVRPGK